MKDKIKKYLVTGGAGFIGSNLVDELIKRKNKVVIIDNLSSGKKEYINPKAKFYKLDICSKKINDVFKKEKPEYVFHLAAIPRVSISVEEPVKTTETNVLGTVNIFKSSYENKVQRVVFASSSSVYGDKKEFPFKETMSVLPINPYGLQKLQGEQFAKLFSDFYNLSIVCLRYFNVYGPRTDFDSDYGLVLGRFLKLFNEKKPLTIYGNGEQSRSFCFVEDVIEANIKAMHSKKIKNSEIINIGGNKSVSINYLAGLISKDKIYLPKRKGDAMHTVSDIKKAKKLLDWFPKTDIKEGVEKTKEWFKYL